MKMVLREVNRNVPACLCIGALWNPELMDHEAVRHILIAARDVIEIVERRLDAANAELVALRLQLQDGMKDCTIQSMECEQGHSWLIVPKWVTPNWVDPGCVICKLAEAQRDLAGEA